MIAFAAFLFALLVIAWLFAPTERQSTVAAVAEREPTSGAQPEGQTA